MEQLCSVDIDLTFDPTSIRCHLYGTEEDTNATNDYASKVLQRCLSIPVTMRAILRQVNCWEIFILASFSLDDPNVVELLVLY